MWFLHFAVWCRKEFNGTDAKKFISVIWYRAAASAARDTRSGVKWGRLWMSLFFVLLRISFLPVQTKNSGTKPLLCNLMQASPSPEPVYSPLEPDQLDFYNILLCSLCEPTHHKEMLTGKQLYILWGFHTQRWQSELVNFRTVNRALTKTTMNLALVAQSWVRATHNNLIKTQVHPKMFLNEWKWAFTKLFVEIGNAHIISSPFTL